MLKWPEQHVDFVSWAKALDELIGGRKDVAAICREKYKGPWQGRRVKEDYEPAPGEVVREFKSGWHILQPLSVDNLVKHLRGAERLGVYVLDDNNQVKFLAADFDDHGGKLEPGAVWAEVETFVDTCETHDWQVHVERSKSGTGYHVWLFFDAPVDAGKARAIGKWLFEESQLIDAETDFSTFDRFFPVQSQLSGKGFGNLLWLPMCGFNDYREGKTAWVNKENKSVSDPVAYTNAILDRGRNSAARVDAFMAEWGLSPELTKDVPEPSEPVDKSDLGTADEWAEVVKRCKAMQWAEQELPPEENFHIDEPLWVALISNAARFDVDDWIHEISKLHRIGKTGYDNYETQYKIDYQRKNSGPCACIKIQELGFKGCPNTGCALPGENRIAKAPAGLAGWTKVREFPKQAKYSRSANVKPRTREEAQEQLYGGDLPINEETGEPWPEMPEGWRMGEGVIHSAARGGADLITCRPIWVEAKTRSIYGEPGVLVRFYDQEMKPRRYAFPARRLNETGSTLGVELMDLEFPTISGKEKWLARYLLLQWADTTKKVISTSALGWIKTDDSAPAFVLPEQIIGSPTKEIVYQPENSGTVLISKCLHRKGELKDWQAKIANEVYGHPFLMLALMMGLAGPLSFFCDVETAGFHFYGTSSRGKTTMAQVCASVWGNGEDPQTARGTTAIRTWNATGAALEGTAELYNHSCLCLDEIGECDPFELGKIIYQLSGGISKGRGMAQGGIRAFKTWRLLFLSTGEKSVKQIITSTGQTMKGGQRVRMPDIPVDTPEGGSDIVWGDKGEQFVRALKTNCGRHYGIAGPVFVGMLIGECATKGINKVAGELKAELAEIEKQLKSYVNHLPHELSRVVRRFAVCCLAGMRASQAGIVDWDLQEIRTAVAHVMFRWLEDIGAEVNETDRALAHLQDAIIKNLSRFHHIESEAKVPHSRDLVGFIADDYFLFTGAGLAELCGEFDIKLVLNTLKLRGLLWSDKGKLTRKCPKPIEALGKTRPYLYWVSKEFLGSAEDDDEGIN